MIKRLFDIVFSLVALLLLLPLLLAFALAIALSSPGGAFFRQVRVGKGGREFRLLKFKASSRSVVEIHASLVSAIFSARPSWTSCRSCGTC